MADKGSAYTDKELDKMEKKIQKIYAEAEKDIEKKIDEFGKKHLALSNKYSQMVDDGEMTHEQFSDWLDGQIFQEEQWFAKKDQIIKIMQNANKEAAKVINGGTIDTFAENANWSHYEMEHEEGLNFGFGLYDAHTVTNLIKKDPQLLPKWKINEKKDYKWNAKKVDNAITQGIIQGEDLGQITKRLTTALSANNRNTMLTFARTAMTGAQNAGRNQALMDAKELGIDVVKVWMATLDDHTRASHQEMDGEEQKVGDIWHPFKFSNGCRFPGDPLGPPHEVYNCRCTLVSDIKKYPAEYKRYDNIEGKPIRNMTYNQWESIRKSEEATNIHVNLPTPMEFKHDFDLAKSTMSAGQEWRVDDTYTVKDYEHKTLFELDGGSVVAVTSDGDIVSVCKKLSGNPANDDRGSQLLKVAIANGGVKLDAFGPDLYKFYTKNGFEPVSWTPFNEEYAPHDWVKGRDNYEPVIFYRYTGNPPSIPYDEFLLSTKACEGPDGYDDAKVIRDRLIDSAK